MSKKKKKVRNEVGHVWAGVCKWLLRSMGWTTVSGPAPVKKAVILGAPHTSVFDFLICYLYYAQYGKLLHIMIKKEFFVWPMGPMLRAFGAVPVDRSSAAAAVKSLIEVMNDEEQFHFGISPEGTRKATVNWKMGYRLIARETGATVYGGFFDWKTKQIGLGSELQVTEDANYDKLCLHEYYKCLNLHGFYEDSYLV